jgi:hypothetical protein
LFVALLLCTSRRLDRATGRLIAAIESAGLLSDGELDELTDAFLADELELVYPLTWVSPRWVEVDLQDPTCKRPSACGEATGQGMHGTWGRPRGGAHLHHDGARRRARWRGMAAA